MFGEEFRRYVENDLMKREPHPDAKPLGAFQSAGALNRCCVEPLLTGKGIKMRLNKIIRFAVGAMLAATAAWADEISIVSNILGPEGPLYVDGNLYYVGWVSNTLSKWDGKTITMLNHTPGCGHNGLALTKQKTFLLACTEEHGAILELDMTG